MMAKRLLEKLILGDERIFFMRLLLYQMSLFLTAYSDESGNQKMSF